jgi:CRP/FNR family cyclic AMP-dependent transcriptional regulator
MPADTSLLAAVPLFEHFDDEERALLAEQLEEEAFQPGQLVFRRGDPGGAIFIVADGEVEIFIEDSTGERIVFETAKAGDFFGELSLLDGESRSASALALAPTRALRVDRGDLQLLFTRHPTAAMDVLAVIGRRLREADRKLGVRASRASPNEIADEKVTPVQRVADALADFSGRFSFLLVHCAWFAAWIAVNVDLVPGLNAFDPYPFGLLTMVVSLEAIFLSCMVLISQNRQASKARIRSDAEYEANIRAGLEVTQLHVKVDGAYEQLCVRLGNLERLMGQKPPPAAS